MWNDGIEINSFFCFLSLSSNCEYSEPCGLPWTFSGFSLVFIYYYYWQRFRMGTFVSQSTETRHECGIATSKKISFVRIGERRIANRLSVRGGCCCRSASHPDYYYYILLLFDHCELSRLIFFFSLLFLIIIFFSSLIQKYKWRGERVGRVKTWTAFLASELFLISVNLLHLIYFRFGECHFDSFIVFGFVACRSKTESTYMRRCLCLCASSCEHRLTQWTAVRLRCRRCRY